MRGYSVADALQDAADHLGEPLGDDSNSSGVALPEPERAGYLLRIGRRAMACEFEVLLNARQYPQGMEAAVAALDLVDELEAQLTVYRDSSEISRLNQSAHMAPVEVESRLFDLLAKAAQIHDETGGAYDITSGPLSKAWGFYRRAGRMPSDHELAETMQRIGMQHLQFDAERLTVAFDRPGVEINLGSIGKGYALDRAADSLSASGIANFLLHGGNSSVLARGSSASPQAEPKPKDEEAVVNAPNTDGWWIGLRHPLLPRRRIGEIRLRDGAVGTSGSGTQFFVHEGRRYGHILDPRTGRPAEGTLSTTVVAGTGAEADALATAFYVLGAAASIDFCRQHPGVSAVIMSPLVGSSRVELILVGIDDDDLKIYAEESISIRPVEA
jgi:thiamine biosynthesis lipoprotein